MTPHRGPACPAPARRTRHPVFPGSSPTLAFLALLLAACLSPVDRAAGQTVGSVEVVPLDQPAGVSSDYSLYGYVEHRVRLTNRADENRTVSLSAPTLGEMPSWGPFVNRLRRDVTLAPGATTTVRFYQPALPLASETVDVVVLPDNKSQTLRLPGANHCDVLSMFGLGGRESSLSCLVTPGVPHQKRLRVEKAVAPLLHYASGLGFVAHRWEADPADLSPSWLAYTRFDLILAQADDLRHIPAQARQAIMGHIHTGGNLLVNVRSPDEISELRRLLGLRPGGSTETCGFGAVGFARPDLQDSPTRAETTILRAARDRMRFRTLERRANPDGTLPVVEDLSVPVRGLFMIMLLFVVFIGPVNYLVLSAWNRRGLLLVTVPAISVVTCGLVLVYSLLSEGLAIRERTVAVTVLDERTHRAATVGWAGFYAPVAPGDGLRFDYDTEVTPLIDLDNQTLHGYSIDWTSGQHLNNGWMQSRVPLHMVLRRWQLRRERLTVRTGADGTLRVVNGLGATIRQVWLADRQGQIHQAGPVSPGAEATLRPTGQSAQQGDAPAPLGNLLRSSSSGPVSLARQLTARPDVALRPGTYVAHLDDAPFLETGLEAGQRNVQNVVYGIMAGSGSPEGSTDGR